MNLLVLQLREEVRRLRPLLPVWALCLVVASVWAALHATLPPRPDATVDLFGGTPIAVFLLVLLPGAALAKTIGLTDPALLPEAGWHTRPLRGTPLASAKLATVALVILVPPALAETIVTLAVFGPGTVPAVWGYYGTVGLAGCVALVALGALTGRWERFAALVAAGAVLLVLAALMADGLGLTHRLEPSLIASRIVIGSLAATAGGIALLYVVYVRRRSAEAYALAFGVFFACGAVFFLWPVDFYRRAPKGVSVGSAATVSASPARVVIVQGGGPDKQNLHVTLRVEGLPPDWTPAGRNARLPDGGQTRWRKKVDVNAAHGSAALAAAQAAAGSYTADGATTKPGPATNHELYIEVTPPLREALSKPGGHMRLEVEFDLFRFEPIGTLPWGTTGTVSTARIRMGKRYESWRPGYAQAGLLYAMHLPLLDRNGPLVRNLRSQFAMPIALVDDQGPRLAERGPYLSEIGQNELSLMPFAISRRSVQAEFLLRPDEVNGVGVLRQLREEPVMLLYSAYMGTIVREVEVRLEDNGHPPSEVTEP